MMADHNDQPNQVNENSDGDKAKQDLDDLTVLSRVDGNSLGDARLNTVRSADISDTQLGNLANVQQGSSGSPQAQNLGGLSGGAKTGLDVAIDASKDANVAPPPLDSAPVTVSDDAAFVQVQANHPGQLNVQEFADLARPDTEFKPQDRVEAPQVGNAPIAGFTPATSVQQTAVPAEHAAEKAPELHDKVNHAPTTQDVSLTGGNEDNVIIIRTSDLLKNAGDADGDSLTVTNLTANHGTLVDNHDGTYSFTPDANYHGGVDLSYTISDGNGGTVHGAASFDVASVNDAPTTSDVTLAAGTEDNSVIIRASDLLAHAGDVDGDTLSVTALSATNGSITDNHDGTYTFTPNADFHGDVDLHYTISDGNGGTVPGTASFEVTSVNDAPTTSDVGLANSAENNAVIIKAEDLLAHASDVDGDTLSVSALSANNGTITDNHDGTYTFTPDANFHGEVDLHYTISDGNGGTVPGTARFDVEAPAPVVDTTPPADPTPVVDTTPPADPTPVVDTTPPADPTPVVDTTPPADPTPVVDTTPPADPTPVVDTTPPADPTPVVDTTPPADPTPVVDTTPPADPTPVVDTTPPADPTPVVDTTPPADPTPVVDTTPPADPTPVVDTTPPADPTPVVDTTPPADPTPVVDTTPPADPTPVVDTTPPADPTPVVDTTPPADPTPTEDNTPPVEPTPTEDNTPPVEPTPTEDNTPPVEPGPPVTPPSNDSHSGGGGSGQSQSGDSHSGGGGSSQSQSGDSHSGGGGSSQSQSGDSHSGGGGSASQHSAQGNHDQSHGSNESVTLTTSAHVHVAADPAATLSSTIGSDSAHTTTVTSVTGGNGSDFGNDSGRLVVHATADQAGDKHGFDIVYDGHVVGHAGAGTTTITGLDVHDGGKLSFVGANGTNITVDSVTLNGTSIDAGTGTKSGGVQVDSSHHSADLHNGSVTYTVNDGNAGAVSHTTSTTTHTQNFHLDVGGHESQLGGVHVTGLHAGDTVSDGGHVWTAGGDGSITITEAQLDGMTSHDAVHHDFTVTSTQGANSGIHVSGMDHDGGAYHAPSHLEANLSIAANGAQHGGADLTYHVGGVPDGCTLVSDSGTLHAGSDGSFSVSAHDAASLKIVIPGDGSVADFNVTVSATDAHGAQVPTASQSLAIGVHEALEAPSHSFDTTGTDIGGHQGHGFEGHGMGSHDSDIDSAHTMLFDFGGGHETENTHHNWTDVADQAEHGDHGANTGAEHADWTEKADQHAEHGNSQNNHSQEHKDEAPVQHQVTDDHHNQFQAHDHTTPM
ncbi:Large exoprotein involved in heme utilization or adhesion [Paramagnetospirillum magnetotacticum MS-1]|uniref:Large exoprotein involved in heme utilization or adhesion n=1 Tax=Paramagnetospirillum magnetotacticum MS-1 TaxID=272627 RepID=A0A0C2YF45_PARME|nr:cadherin-like domain-containing protein [Paramagnetospirillum magnetotacticum]KIL98339.1 Large exoprotein involved in heme utilization or adhesion [Paramagnetospirillum magnetotacticum MS-1]